MKDNKRPRGGGRTAGRAGRAGRAGLCSFAEILTLYEVPLVLSVRKNVIE